MINATPILKAYAKMRLAKLNSMDPATTQQEQLLRLLRRANNTVFGSRFSFSTISSVEDYQRIIPLRTYENFWEEFWKESFPHFEGVTWPGKVKYIPVSSGTSSGTTKWIPYTSEMASSNTKAGLDLLVYHLHNRPQSKIFGGKSFILGGSTDLVERAPGIYSGDLSGIAVKTLPWWAKMRYYPPADIALIKDWEEKIGVLTKGSLQEDIRTLSGVPNWLLILFERLKALRPESGGLARNLYPNLEMLVHGGVSFAPYLSQFQEILEGSKAELREVYPASEGFIGVADRGYGDGLRLNLDHGIFFEFVPVDELGSKKPTRHWIKNVQPDINYAVVLTTCAGLWSYMIGDTVKFVDTKTPRVLITGRTSYYISAFGEHLIGEEIEEAVSTAAQYAKLTVTDYSMGAIYPKSSSELGGHIFIVEFSPSMPSTESLKEFETKLDRHLCLRNEDFDAHRQKNFGFNAPIVIAARPGMFAAWMKSRGKLGGQNKVPRIILKDELLESLKKFALEYNGTI